MFNKKYDILVVGCGLFGSVVARQAKEAGKTVLMIDKRPHIAGNLYTKEINSIHTHVYGPHCFHTKSKEIWDYVNKFAEFGQYRLKVNAQYKGKMYSLPFNLTTFNQLWGCMSPGEAEQKLLQQKVKIENPQNLEEWALTQVGPEIYEKFIKGYTTKQWGRPPKYLPASIIKRIPIRLTYNTDYHEAKYSGVPVNGYTNFIGNMIDGIEIKLDTDFFDIKDWRRIAKKLVYCGPIDKFYNYKYGALEYRTLRFQNNIQDGDFQGIAQVNHTEDTVPYTRIVEHKHFYNNPERNPKTVITFEYPDTWDNNKEPYYPINDESNNTMYKKYREDAKKETDIIISGRLGNYLYLDMDQIVALALRFRL